ncbi:hypothetical protein HDV05_005732 [Chytridiales sp. JEL 0842]|nr:hypothetical protein HDV05_005732 [Chytridiales sp. JEL 0842]
MLLLQTFLLSAAALVSAQGRDCSQIAANLQSASDLLAIQTCSSLASLSMASVWSGLTAIDLPNLQTVTGGVSLLGTSSNASPDSGAPADTFMERLSMPALTQVGGSFTLRTLRGLRTLKLGSLETVIGDWDLQTLPMLSQMGEPPLSALGGKFRVVDTGISMLKGLNFAQALGGVEVSSNGRLEGLEFAELLEVGEAGFKVTLNKDTLSLKADKLGVVHGDLTLSQIGSLSMLSLSSVMKSMDVSENTFSGLQMPSLSSIGSSLVLRSNPTLSNVTFPQLERIRGSLSLFEQSPNVRDLSQAFPTLSEIQGSVNITLPSLEALSFPRMREIRGSMEITASDKMDCGAKRSFAVATSSIEYNRKGDQVPVAPTAIKAVSKSTSGITVATHDSRGPVSSLAVVIAAGSRNESVDAPGVAHFLKSTLVRNVPGDNVVRSLREFELRGDTLYTGLTREHIIIGSTFLRDDLVDVVPSLVNHVFNPAFQPYEFLDTIPKLLSESSASLADPSVEVFDKLHQVAFRTGLGNSLFATAAGVKSLKRAHLQEFAAKTFTADKIAVVGSGVAHEELKAIVDESLKGIAVAASKYTPAASKYSGGEARIEAGPKSSSTFAVALKSVSYSSPEYPASLVLRSLLDGTQHTKWGSASGSSTLLSKAASSNTSVSAFTTSYSDAGLVGFVVEGEASEIKAVAQKAIDAFKSVASGTGITSEALARAKKTAIIDAENSGYASRDDVVHNVGKQVLATGSYATIGDLASSISKVTAEDVKKLAASAIAAKASVVARGNLLKLPYADDLKTIVEGTVSPSARTIKRYEHTVLEISGISEGFVHKNRAIRPGYKSDYLIVNRRREEESRNRMKERTNYYAHTALQSQFEESSTNAIRRNHLSRRVDEMKETENRKLEERRDRLRKLFEDDEEKYTNELLQQEETTESRVQKMRARMSELKAKREAERQQIVEQKLLQRWRNECDELRAIESKVLEKEVSAARAGQLAELQQKKLQELEEKKFYDDLWEQDRQKKIAREESDRIRHREMNTATVAMLEAQLESLRKQALEEERLKQEEAILMRQEMQLRQLEDQRNLARKLTEQRAIRADLDRFNKMKIEQRAREIREALELDLKIVNEFFKMDQAAAQSKNRRRAELRKEMQLYKEHLLEQQRIEREREMEIEKLQKEEEEKSWAKRAEKWQKEQKARDKLMQEVLQGRQEQLQYAIEQNRLRQEQTIIEREQLLQQIEVAQKVEAAERARKEHAAEAYRGSLASQMESVEERRREQKRFNELEAAAEKIAEQEYKKLLESETQRAINKARSGRIRMG